MKNTILFAALFLAAASLNAQSFQKTYGGRFADLMGYSLAATSDKGFLFTGSGKSVNGAANANILLIRTNNSGDTLWTRSFGGAYADDGYYAMETADSGYLVGGDTYSFGAGRSDAYVLRTDKKGKLLWSKTYGGAGSEDITGAIQTADGGFLLLGSTSSYGAGDFDIYLLRINASGDTLWTKTIGGPKADFGLCLRVTADKGFIISGYTQSFGAGEDDALLLKLDTDGQLQWMKTYGGKSSDAGSSVLQTADGGFLLSGKTHSFQNPVDGDAYLVRTDNNGDTLWTRQYGESNGTEWAHDAAESSTGELLVTGDTYSFGAGHSDVYLLRTDQNGNVLGSKTYGTASFDYGRSIWQDTDGSYVIGGQSSGFGDGDLDLYLIKEERFNGNETCNQQWAATASFPTPTHSSSVFPLVSGTTTIINNPATLTGAGMQYESLCLAATALQEPAKGQPINIFPNPATGIFTVSLNKAQRILVYDLNGNIVYREEQQRLVHQLDLSWIPKGIYILRSGADGEQKGTVLQLK